MSMYIVDAKFRRTDLDETGAVKIRFAQDDKKPISEIFKTAVNRAYAEISEYVDSSKWELCKISVKRVNKEE